MGKEKIPLVSVVIPVYNAETYIRECLDSVLSQSFQDFETIIGNDGSTDRTAAIIESYRDSRIRLLNLEHDYIATQNCLLDEARGKYVVRMDSDDRMLPDRLSFQVHYMEEHPNIDVLGGGMSSFGLSSQVIIPTIVNRPISFPEMLKGNQISNPTTIIRKAALDKNHLRHDKQYQYANDYYLWLKMLQAGCKLQNVENLFVEYRFSLSQVSAKHQKEQQACAELIREKIVEENVRRHLQNANFSIKKSSSNNKLTLIIPFLNEGEEVRNTVASARAFVGEGVDILVINDHSTDCYDYRADLQDLNVTYVYNKERLGVAASRDLGVRLCVTPYFLLLDAHMRFYDNQWVDTIVRLLEADDRCVLCAQTLCLSKEDGRVSERKEVPTAYGAYMPLYKGSYMPDIKWNSQEFRPHEAVEPIPAVLGAGYAASKRYWLYLKGLEGLCYYGCDEIYLSLKTWLEGGRCLLLKEVVIGHIYRDRPPYRHYNDMEVFNYLFIAQVVFPISWRGLAFATAKVLHPAVYEKALSHLTERHALVRSLQTYYRRIFTVPFASVLQMNRRCAMKGQEPRLKHLERLAAVTDFVLSHEAAGSGLCEGRMGQLVWLLHCAGTGKQSAHSVLKLWNSVWDAVREKQLPHNFKYGLEGIGWSLVYLHRKGLIEDDITEYLQTIDEQLAVYNPEADVDNSLLTGRGGWMAYRLARTAYFRFKGEPSASDSVERARTERIVTELLDHADEVSVLSYAWQMQWLLTEEADKDDVSLELHDWMDFSDFVPGDSKYWSPALTGNALSSTLYAKLIKDNAYGKQ